MTGAAARKRNQIAKKKRRRVENKNPDFARETMEELRLASVYDFAVGGYKEGDVVELGPLLAKAARAIDWLLKKESAIHIEP